MGDTGFDINGGLVLTLKNFLQELVSFVRGHGRRISYHQDFEKIAASEYNAVIEFCRGNGIDVCCGAKVFPGALGIDIVPFGEATAPWGYSSHAQLAYDCIDLPFKDDTLDFVIGIHAIEHFENPVETITEWLRVVKPSGYVCLIVPDRRHTPPKGHPHFDITHKREYTPEEFTKAISSITGEGLAEVISYDSLNNDWSFECVLRKTRGRV